MAINDAISAYAAQTGAADQAYKDAWANTPTGGAGQFGGAGVFESASNGLSASGASSPLPGIASNLMKGFARAAKSATNNPSGGGQIDALPTTPTASTSTDPIQASLETTSNYSATSPYVADVTDEGAVGRQSIRPERLAIDDTMSSEEQYRRAWQNESNGFYGNEVAATEKPAAEVAPNKPAEIVKPASVEYGIDYTDSTDAQDSVALVYDKATGRIVKQLDSSETVGLSQKLNGAETVNSDDLKKYTGWEAPAE